ncbi:restriction endonuclease subunit S [Cohnella sp. GCM10012308]|uniref:restriction endonuclease subunit S n=1 Tax=Cohnella sp. GCM10012308 TaxID=3317329 RepID=UPI00361FC6D0
MKKYKVGQILNRVKDPLVIEDGQEYKRLTIRMYHKGVCVRDVELGENIGTKNQFLAHGGQFIMSRIDARNGAFGIIPETIDEAAITNDFINFTVNNDIVDIDFFELYSQTKNFMQLCIEGSKGTTNRKRLKEEMFLEFEVALPEVQIQKELVAKAKKLISWNENLNSELSLQSTYVHMLRHSIQQEAIQGKLVPQDPNDEPASVLLERIRAEKEQLIKEKKIKKEKPLPAIKEDEVPYELPIGWEWVRFSDIGELERGKSKHRPRNDEVLFEKGKYPLVQTGDVARSNGLIKTYSNLYNEVGLNQSRLWSAGTLCITIAANIADTGVLSFDACFPDSVVGFVPYKPIVSVSYFYYFVKISKEMLNKYAPSTAQKNINLSILNELLIPLPPLNEMIRIVQKVDQLFLLCDQLDKNVAQSRKENEMLMQSVLQETV